ncbi:hypothetical protein [Caulobacter sp. 17J65-9]|uniref:hypothetical protein n=1 Tax=Caulobacter sp. 17J65-9 TaxID=2709382 RepID=UPI0013C74B25|nr:hypothetical protein [Caulobacter sp. 17J65-9]NEX94476.1 hypothetical protein [Caulobacter sp. 17J65-9]
MRAAIMTTYSIIVMKDGSSPSDVSRGEIMNIEAPWDMVEAMAKFALARYPGADRAVVVDEMGVTHWEWPEVKKG